MCTTTWLLATLSRFLLHFVPWSSGPVPAVLCWHALPHPYCPRSPLVGGDFFLVHNPSTPEDQEEDCCRFKVRLRWVDWRCSSAGWLPEYVKPRTTWSGCDGGGGDRKFKIIFCYRPCLKTIKTKPSWSPVVHPVLHPKLYRKSFFCVVKSFSLLSVFIFIPTELWVSWKLGWCLVLPSCFLFMKSLQQGFKHSCDQRCSTEISRILPPPFFFCMLSD